MLSIKITRVSGSIAGFTVKGQIYQGKLEVHSNSITKILRTVR